MDCLSKPGAVTVQFCTRLSGSNVTEPILPTMQHCYCVTSLETIDYRLHAASCGYTNSLTLDDVVLSSTCKHTLMCLIGEVAL